MVIGLEELALDYRLLPIQEKKTHPDPTKVGGGVARKVPVLVDHAPADGSEALTSFESGEILRLAEKVGAVLGLAKRGRGSFM